MKGSTAKPRATSPLLVRSSSADRSSGDRSLSSHGTRPPILQDASLWAIAQLSGELGWSPAGLSLSKRRPSADTLDRSDLSDSFLAVSRITATDAARNFSDLLNRVAAGEEIELTRSGAPVAVIGPPSARLISAERFREVIVSAPSPDEDFAKEVRVARAAVGAPDDPWPS